MRKSCAAADEVVVVSFGYVRQRMDQLSHGLSAIHTMASREDMDEVFVRRTEVCSIRMTRVLVV